MNNKSFNERLNDLENSLDENLDDNLDDEDDSEIMDFVPPGIIRIECFPEKKAWFVHVSSCYFGARNIFESLWGSSDPDNRIPKSLIKDYKKYGNKNNQNFGVEFEVCGWEYKDDTVLIEKTIQECKSKWSGNFY